MKLLFWSAIILGSIWWIMKKNQGAGNDLTAHLEEQLALQSIGHTAATADGISHDDWPLSTIGSTPLAGLYLDPFNSQNPFTTPNPGIMYQGQPQELNN